MLGWLTLSPGHEFKSNAEVVEYPFRRIAAFEHRGHHQVGAAHHITARKDLGIRRLKFMFAARRRLHTATLVALYAELGAPRRGIGLDAEGDDDAIRRN